MSMSVTELAALPIAPTVSKALTEAAWYVDEGPYLALRRAVYGSVDFNSFIAAITPEHALAEGVALIVVASLIDPAAEAGGLPTPAWTAGSFSEAVRHAHQIIGVWADDHTAIQLAHLFEGAADHVAKLEAPHA